MPGADQVAVANTIKAVTKPDRSIDPSQLNSLPKGSWVAVNYKNQKLDLFNLFQVGDQPLATKGPDGKIPTFDDSVLKGRLSTPDLCHFSATATAGFYGKYFTDGSKAFQVSDNEAAQLIEATRQAPHVASGHIGTNSVRRYKNFAQKLAMGLAAPFAMFALIRNPLG